MFKGCTFENQNVTSKNDGGLYQNIYSEDGILWGCTMSVANNALTIQSGELMVGGRLVWVDGATQVTFDNPIANGYGQVILTIDLSKTATTDTFEQIEASAVYSATSVFSELIQGDINGAGNDMIYQLELAVVRISGSNITGIVRQIGDAAIDAEKFGGNTANDFFDWMFPVGSIYQTMSSTFNPNTSWRGTWQQIAQGRTLVGVDTGDEDFNAAAKTGGEKEHILSYEEMPRHSHTLRFADMGNPGGGFPQYQMKSPDPNAINPVTSEEGWSNAHNNMQPYITCYIWQRMA